MAVGFVSVEVSHVLKTPVSQNFKLSIVAVQFQNSRYGKKRSR